MPVFHRPDQEEGTLIDSKCYYNTSLAAQQAQIAADRHVSAKSPQAAAFLCAAAAAHTRFSRFRAPLPRHTRDKGFVV